jgi:methylaspartate ammonia-lyase
MASFALGKGAAEPCFEGVVSQSAADTDNSSCPIGLKMRIKQAVFSNGRSGYYNNDFQALRLGATADGAFYREQPVSTGFEKISQPGQCINAILGLDNGAIALGDCVDVILAGIGGRFPPFNAEIHFKPFERIITDFLLGQEVDAAFDTGAAWTAFAAEHGLHTAVRYGVSQALLHAASLSRGQLVCEVIQSEYGIDAEVRRVPLLVFCQTESQLHIDRAIMKRADLLPHGSFPDVEKHLGAVGEKLISYVERISKRVIDFGDDDYAPTIHLDVYGSIGKAFPNPVEMAHYLMQLKTAAGGFQLMVESPIVAQTQSEQIERFAELREALSQSEDAPQIIVDEWCNTAADVRLFADHGVADIIHIKTPDMGTLHDTIEVAKYCRQKNVGFAIGGSANETDVSGRMSAHIGLATQPVFMIGRPGMGMDEGLMIVDNEQRRSLALLQ